jgi:hypothetical protein
MEQKLEMYTPDDSAPTTPGPIQASYVDPENRPRITVTPKERDPILEKPMDEPFKDQGEKEGAWKIMMHNVFNQPEIAAQDFRKGVKLWAEKTVGNIVKAIQAPGDALQGNLDPNSDEGIKRSADLAALVMAGPAPIAAKVVDGTLGVMGGIRSRTVKSSDVVKAKEMQAKGASVDEIYESTGLFRGMEGKWRTEIPDQKARFTENIINRSNEIVRDPHYFLET